MCSFTVNKQCLKPCLVFCSYGCYSSGRPVPWALVPFQALLLSALLRQDLVPDCRLGHWPACFLHALSWQSWGTSHCICSHHSHVGSCGMFSQHPQSSSEATMTVISHRNHTNLAVQGRLPLPSIISSLCLHHQGGPLGFLVTLRAE